MLCWTMIDDRIMFKPAFVWSPPQLPPPLSCACAEWYGMRYLYAVPKIMGRGNWVDHKAYTIHRCSNIQVRSIRAFWVQPKMANIPAFVMEFTWYRILYTRSRQGLPNSLEDRYFFIAVAYQVAVWINTPEALRYYVSLFREGTCGITWPSIEQPRNV